MIICERHVSSYGSGIMMADIDTDMLSEMVEKPPFCAVKYSIGRGIVLKDYDPGLGSFIVGRPSMFSMSSVVGILNEKRSRCSVVYDMYVIVHGRKFMIKAESPVETVWSPWFNVGDVEAVDNDFVVIDGALHSAECASSLVIGGECIC